MKKHYSVFWEPGPLGQKVWFAQVLEMPDESILRSRRFIGPNAEVEARKQLKAWREAK